MLSNGSSWSRNLNCRHVQGDVARIGHDLQLGRSGDEAAVPFLEIALVGEGQAGAGLLQHPHGMDRGRLALGMESVP
jgi:hypothetical protein